MQECDISRSSSAMCWQDTHFSQSVKRGLLSPDFSKFMIYGAGFGILKGGGSFACSYGNLTDDFERSIRYVKKYRKSLTFPIIHLRKQVAAGGGDRQAVAAQSVREGLRMSLDLLKDSLKNGRHHHPHEVMLLSRLSRRPIHRACQRWCC